MNRLPFPKGVWLSLITAVAIVGIMTAGVVASLGCGGSEEARGAGDAVRLTATAEVFARYSMSTSAAKQVPVVGQDVLFQWQQWRSVGGHDGTVGPLFQVTKRTGSSGRCTSIVGYTLRKDEYLVCSVTEAGSHRQGPVLIWTWQEAVDLAGQDLITAISKSCELIVPVF